MDKKRIFSYHNKLQRLTAIDVKKIAADQATQEILEDIFKSQALRKIWQGVNSKLTVPIKIIALPKEECRQKFQASSSMVPTRFKERLAAIRIYFDCELDKRLAAVAVIDQIMNADIVTGYLELFDEVSRNKIHTKEEFALKMIELRWLALNKSLPIIEELGLNKEIETFLPSFRTFEDYLQEQRQSGQMKLYENDFVLHERKVASASATTSKMMKKPDVAKISKDPATQEILNAIFESNTLRWHWQVLNSSTLTFGTKVIPLDSPECFRQFQRPSSIKLTTHKGEISGVRIFYDREMNETSAKIALIYEIINANFAKHHQKILNYVSRKKIATKEEFARSIEKIEWMALKLSLPVIKELRLEQFIESKIEMYENFDEYLEVQKQNGHTQIYEEAFSRFQDEQKGIRESI